MTVEAMAKRIDGWLRERADEEFGAGQRLFFQHEVASYGTRGDAVREVARLVYGEVKAWAPGQREELMERLWKLGRLESGAVVCHLMRRFARGFGRREFGLFERWLEDHVRNWAHADGVASWLVAGGWMPGTGRAAACPRMGMDGFAQPVDAPRGGRVSVAGGKAGQADGVRVAGGEEAARGQGRHGGERRRLAAERGVPAPPG